MFGSAIEQLTTSIRLLQADVALLDDLDRKGIDVPWSMVSEKLVQMERLREQLDHGIGAVVGFCEARGASALDGDRSMADWLAKRSGQRRTITGSRSWLAIRLRAMPHTDAALAAGEITASHATVLTRAQTPRTQDAFGRDEAMLVDAARTLTADQLVQVVEHWLRHHDLDGPEPAAEGKEDSFHLSQTLDGRLRGDFDLGPESAIRVKAVLDEITRQLQRRDKEARKADPSDPRLGERVSQRRARAFVELCDRAAASPDNPARRQPLFAIHTTLETLTESGDPLDWKTQVDMAWRSAIPLPMRDLWACDAHVSRVILSAEGEPLDVGRSKRLATPAQRRALIAQYGGCAVPGCSAPPGQVEIHHIEWWTKGGATDLDNQMPGCSWHHHRIHAGDITVERCPDGRLQFRLRDGRLIEEPRAGPGEQAAA